MRDTAELTGALAQGQVLLDSTVEDQKTGLMREFLSGLGALGAFLCGVGGGLVAGALSYPAGSEEDGSGGAHLVNLIGWPAMGRDEATVLVFVVAILCGLIAYSFED